MNVPKKRKVGGTVDLIAIVNTDEPVLLLNRCGRCRCVGRVDGRSERSLIRVLRAAAATCRAHRLPRVVRIDRAVHQRGVAGGVAWGVARRQRHRLGRRRSGLGRRFRTGSASSGRRMRCHRRHRLPLVVVVVVHFLVLTAQQIQIHLQI